VLPSSALLLPKQAVAWVLPAGAEELLQPAPPTPPPPPIDCARMP
jgi:hypothetical protein